MTTKGARSPRNIETRKKKAGHAIPRAKVQSGWSAASLVGLNPGDAVLTVSAPGGAETKMAVKIGGLENSL